MWDELKELLLGVVGPVRNAFFHKETDPSELITKLVEFATIARREGILALESQAGDAGMVAAVLGRTRTGSFFLSRWARMRRSPDQ